MCLCVCEGARMCVCEGARMSVCEVETMRIYSANYEAHFMKGKRLWLPAKVCNNNLHMKTLRIGE